MNSSKVTQFRYWILFGGLLALTIVTRFWGLTNKPIHFDESINGWFSDQMTTMGYYKYDLHNYHGPLYFYLLHLFEYFWGQSLFVLRTLPAVFSILSILLFYFPIDPDKRWRAWVLIFLLLSPSFLFFGRSGIHEMPFVFFQMLLALGVTRGLIYQESKALIFLLIGLWGVLTLKETFTVTCFAMVVGLLSLGWQDFKNIFSRVQIRKIWRPMYTWLTLVLALLFVQLYTGFFKNPGGLTDFFKAILPWLKTGVEGKGHEKEFFYWIKVLWQAEPLALWGVVASLFGVCAKNKALRFFSVFSLIQLLIYSAIPYKTVWCVLTLIWGFYFVLAFYSAQRRWLQFLLIPFLFYNGLSSYRSVYANPIEMNHPYVYVNSTYDLKKLTDFIFAEVVKNPDLLGVPVQVGMKEQWPWPWLLRQFSTSNYSLCGKSQVAGASIYFCDLEDESILERSLLEPYWKVIVPMRQAKENSIVYLKKSSFQDRPPFAEVKVVGAEK